MHNRIAIVMSLSDIEKIFTNFRKIAVVGMSRDPQKPSHWVPKYLLDCGYKIFPVNPTADKILDLSVYKSISDIPDDIEVVLIFRPSEYVLPIVEEVIKRAKDKKDVKAIWLQEGIENDKAKEIAEREGLIFIQNRCMYKEHRNLYHPS